MIFFTVFIDNSQMVWFVSDGVENTYEETSQADAFRFKRG